MKRQTNNLFQRRDEVPCQVSLCDTEFSFFSLLLVFPNLYSCLICLLPSTLCKLTVYLDQSCLQGKNFFFVGGEVILVLNFPCQYNFPQLFPLEKFSGWLIKLGSRQGQGRCQSMQAVATSWQLLPTIPLFSSSYFSFHNFYINLFGFTSKSIMSSTMSTGGQEPEVKPEIGAWKTHKIYSLIAAQIYLRGNIACGAYPVNTDGPVGARHSKTQ